MWILRGLLASELNRLNHHQAGRLSINKQPHPSAASNKLPLIVPRIVLLFRRPPRRVWVLILLFGTPTATAPMLTTLAALVTTLVLTWLTLISLLATLILTLISRHHFFPS